MPYTLASPAHSELLIRKSRFIGCVRSVADRQAAQAIVDALKLEHPGAVHVCWALMAGGQSAAVDDGEPSGTAGRPMLDVLRHHDLDGVLATVVRYFGGVKLGAGGLVRAYTDCVAQALLGAEKIEKIKEQQLRFCAPYALEGLLRHALDQAASPSLEISHGDLVHFHVTVPQHLAPQWIAQLNESSHGRLTWLEPPPQVNDAGQSP